MGKCLVKFEILSTPVMRVRQSSTVVKVKTMTKLNWWNFVSSYKPEIIMLCRENWGVYYGKLYKYTVYVLALGCSAVSN